jgi:DNA-directed RNA polymerase specialized sigma24 family protein
MSQPRLRIVRDREESAGELNEPLSFDAFFAAESQTLFRRMWLVTRDRHEAEEIVQDAFLSLFERWDRATSWEDPTSYLYRTAFNTWKNRRRRAARAVRNVLSSDPGTSSRPPTRGRSSVLPWLTSRRASERLLS